MEKVIYREKTAISRMTPSTPVIWANSKGYLESTVYDYGSGKGRDTYWLKNNGYDCLDHDPYYHNVNKLENIDCDEIKTVLLIYVLNIIEVPDERKLIIDSISEKCKNAKKIVAVRSHSEIKRVANKSQWSKYKDGFLTLHNTFQKGYTKDELVELCEPFGKLIGYQNKASGIICAFG